MTIFYTQYLLMVLLILLASLSMTLGSNSPPVPLVPVTKLLAGINKSSNQLASAIIDTAKLPRRRCELEKVPIEKQIIMGSGKLIHEKSF